MTSRILPVDLNRLNWFDGKSVTQNDLVTEQVRNVGIDAANQNNFFSSGVLEEFQSPKIIFDAKNLNSQQQSLFDSNSFDGQNVYIGTVNNVSDTINGVLLSVELLDAYLDGFPHIKISIIGDSFGDVLVHDDLIFNTNGTQITKNRYKNIRGILFNNFAGSLLNPKKYACDGSVLVASCIIREALSMEVSQDAVLSSQVAQPNMFWNDFITANGSLTLNQVLQDTIGPSKAISDLNIGLTSKAKRELVPNDVSTRIGQKFKATGNNIQKISTLLSVEYNPDYLLLGEPDGYQWKGDIILTIHKLQTDVDCPVSPIPDNTIDFDPHPSIIGQIAIDKEILEYQGIILTDEPQVVDFVFTGSNISDPLRSNLEVGKYYVFTLGRASNPNGGTILIEEANSENESYMTIYDGSQWININESSMWFSIYGDYIKVSDGVAYDNGIGSQIQRIAKNEYNQDAPYYLGEIPFYSQTYDTNNYTLLETIDQFSEPTQDERTGNSIFTKIKPSPYISLINKTALDLLLSTNPDPVLLALAKDLNPRGNPTSITGQTTYPGLVKNNIFNVLSPSADVLQHNWVGSILYPSVSCGGATCQFRIIKQTNYDDILGDINGDGEIDLDDLAIINGWISAWPGNMPLSLSDGFVQQLILDGYLDILQFLRADVDGDGFVGNTDKDLIEDYINKDITSFSGGSTFLRTELQVENLTGTSEADIVDSCCTSFSTPLIGGIDWRIDYFATWIPDLLNISDLRRLLPTTYTEEISDDNLKGSNNFFVPNNLLVSNNILNPDGSFYSVDLEINHLTLDFPITDSVGNPIFLDGSTGISLFDNFVAESSMGLTSNNFKAMKYADGSYVQIGDFELGRVKITASLQSLSNEFGVTIGNTVQDIVGMYYDPATSLLMLYIKDLYDDPIVNVVPSLSMKILITIYLKHAGFINNSETITKDQMRSILGV